MRICSDDVPGLILSGPDPKRVLGDVWPALLALDQHKRDTANALDRSRSRSAREAEDGR